MPSLFFSQNIFLYKFNAFYILSIYYALWP